MAAQKGIAAAFNLVKKKHLSLIHSIQDSKLVNEVIAKLAHSKTKLHLRYNHNISDEQLMVLTKSTESFCKDHDVEVIIHQSSEEFTEGHADLCIDVIKFSDFSIKMLLDNQEKSFGVIMSNAVDERVRASLKSNKNICCLEENIENQFGYLVQLLDSSWLLKKVYVHKEDFIHNEMKVVYKTLRRRSSILNGNIILNKGKEISLLSNTAKAIQLESTKVKLEFNSAVKAQLQNIENSTDKVFNSDTEEFKELTDEITDYAGFNEETEGKIITFSYPQDYIDTFKGKCQEKSILVFKQFSDAISEKLIAIQNQLLSRINADEKSIDFPDIVIDSEVYEKTVQKDVEFIRNEDRKAGYNGMSAIFGALRTPIYALFPLIMIARFIPSSDTGAIDQSIKTFENQSVVAVSEIPDSYGKSVTKFIAAVNDALQNGDLINRDTGKDMFKYSVSEKGRKTVEYSTMKSGQQMPLIILPVYSDREMASQILMDNILTIQMRMNIVAEVKKIPKILGPFERFFGPVFLSLIMWFIYSKRKSMNDQNVSTQMTETGELKKNRLLEIQNFIKLSDTQAKLNVRNFFKDYLETANRSIDVYYAELMRKEEQQRIKEMKLYKSREKLFQTEMNNIATTQKGIYEVGKEYFKTITKNI